MSMLLEDTLYKVLRGESKYKVRPDIFVNSYYVKDNRLMFESFGRARSIIRTCKFYIPFTSSGILIPEYKNGLYEILPTYQILVLMSPSPGDINQLTVAGVYAMDNTQFEELYLDDDLNVIPYNKINDTPHIKRYEPQSLTINNSMMAFYNGVRNGEIKLSI
jgi:hypothetical protein